MTGRRFNDPDISERMVSSNSEIDAKAVKAACILLTKTNNKATKMMFIPHAIVFWALALHHPILEASLQG